MRKIKRNIWSPILLLLPFCQPRKRVMRGVNIQEKKVNNARDKAFGILGCLCHTLERHFNMKVCNCSFLAAISSHTTRCHMTWDAKSNGNGNFWSCPNIVCRRRICDASVVHFNSACASASSRTDTQNSKNKMKRKNCQHVSQCCWLFNFQVLSSAIISHCRLLYSRRLAARFIVCASVSVCVYVFNIANKWNLDKIDSSHAHFIRANDVLSERQVEIVNGRNDFCSVGAAEIECVFACGWI